MLVKATWSTHTLSGSILNLHIEIRPNARQCSQLCRMLLVRQYHFHIIFDDVKYLHNSSFEIKIKNFMTFVDIDI